MGTGLARLGDLRVAVSDAQLSGRIVSPRVDNTIAGQNTVVGVATTHVRHSKVAMATHTQVT